MSIQTVFLMAGGQGERWTAPSPKELAPINGTPAVSLIMGQCRRRLTLEPYLVTGKKDIIDVARAKFVLRPSNTIIESLQDAIRLVTASPVLVLLSDCVYTSEAWDVIVSAGAQDNTNGLAVIGSKPKGEIYALVIHDMIHVRGALDFAVHSHLAHKTPYRLWSLYRSFCGMPLDIHQYDKTGVFIDIDNDAYDWDLVETYNQVLGYIKTRTL